jgi:hypothetical protein
MIMTNLILSLLLATATQPAATFTLNPAEQAAATKAHDEIALKLAPSAKQKLLRVAQSLANTPNVESSARLGIVNAFPDVNFSDSDIISLMAFVMWEASKDAENDLRNLTEEMNKINEKKAALRNAPDAQSDMASRKLDSLNQTSQRTGLRVQTAMDKRSKFMQTLSNLQKRQHDMAASIIQNLR